MSFFRKYISSSVLLVASLATGVLTHAQTIADVCFAVADGGNRGGLQDKQAEDFLALINKVTGVESNVGFTGTFDIEALAYWPNSQTLYAANGGVLVRLDWKTDGRFTAIGGGIGSVAGPLGSVSVTDVDGLAFDPTTSPPRLYGSVRRALAGENDLLIRIDTNTGQRVANAFGTGVDYLVIENAAAPGGVVCDDVDDLAFDPLDGSLFAVQSDGGANDLLIRINKTDGGVQVVGPLGVDDAEGLAFYLDGSLFVSTGKNSRDITQRDGLYDVDKATGAASNRRASAKEDIEGISCFTANVSLIGDVIWRDDNRNGVKDAAESGLAGVTVRLLRASDAAVLQSRVTGADGSFLFAVPTGGYRVEATAPTGYAISPMDAGGNDALDSDIDPATGRTTAFVVGLNASDTTRDGGMFCLPPVITCPPDLVLECTAGTGTNVTGVATATSPCGCIVSLAFQDSFAASCGATGTITRRWTATDQCGGSSFCDQTIQLIDTTQPLLAGVPADTFAPCDAIPPAPTVTATDACDAEVIPVLTSSTTPGSCPNSYTLTRTWTATDDCGNVRTASQAITVEDLTAPALAGVPADITASCDAIPPAPTVTAIDACDPAVIPLLSTSTTPGNCPQRYTITRTWTATDACGNASTASQVITVQDLTAPVLAGVPPDTTVACDAILPAPTVTATDACDTSVVPLLSTSTTPGSCPQTYTLTRTWTATDACGNAGTASQVITVQDLTAPVLAGVPSDTTVACDAIPPVPTVTATDTCDTSVVPLLSTSTTPGSCPQTYTLTRTWTATDACGNAGTASQVITVQDLTAPVLAGVPPDTTVACDAIPPAPTVTATDACATGVDPVFSSSITPGSCPQSYTLTRTWTATDACGNASTGSQVITVQDTIKPVVTASPGPVTVTCTALIPPPAPNSITATDDCGTVTVTHQGDTFTGTTCNQIIQRSYRVSDACGNFETVTQAITVLDNVRPVQTGFLQDRIFQCVADLNSFVPVSPIVVDNCDGTITAPAPVILNDFSPLNCGRTRRFIWTFRDSCGNLLRITQTLFVRDTRKPVLTCPAPPTLTCDGNGQAVLPALVPGVIDNCGAGGVTLTQSPPAGTILTGAGTTAVTLTATDACGNTQSCPVNVTVSCGSPAVELVKTVYPGHTGGDFCPGGEILVSTNGAPVTYCFEVRNTGPLNLSNLVLTDPSLGLAPQAIGHLGAGQTIMLHAESLLAGSVTNVALVSGTGPQGQPVSDSDEAVARMFAPGIHLEQTVAYGANAPCPGQPFMFAVNGQPVTYCFQVTNTGDTPLARAVVRSPEIDMAPLDAGALAEGQTVMLKYWMTANGSVTNLATASALPPSGPPVVDESAAAITSLGPGGELVKTVYAGHDGGASCPGGKTAFITGPGTPVTFCFAFRNTGDGLLYNATLSDPALLITDLPFATSLAPGAVTNHLEEAFASAPMLNTATVTFLPASGAAMTTTGSATLDIPIPGIELEKKAADGFAGHSGCLLAGQDLLELPEAGPVTWCFIVRNTGNTWLSNITLTDSVLGVAEGEMEYTGPALPLAPGEEGVWRIFGRAEASIRNQALATGVPSAPDGTPIPGQPLIQSSDSADVIVNGQPIP